MNKVKIAFRQIIDAKSTGEFEKNIFNDSFSEFYLQAQAYNPNRQFRTLREMVEHNPKANSLHFKVGFSIGLYTQSLEKTIPGLTDSIGKIVPFESHEFEILHSDVTNKAAHRVAITYITPSLDLFAVSGGFLVLGQYSNQNAATSTLTISMQQNLSIVEWGVEQEIQNKPVYETGI